MNTEVTFISIDEFKSQTGHSSFRVLKNPKTEKLFVALPDGGTMRCQRDFNPKEPAQFINDKDAEITQACLINYDASKGAEEIASF